MGKPSHNKSVEDDDTLSLSDLPLVAGETNHPEKARSPRAKIEEEDFEFRVWGNGLFLEKEEDQMCSADDVFFKGQLLPLRPSTCSDRDSSGYWSRSESMDHIYRTRSNSSNSSSSSNSINTHMSSVSSQHRRNVNKFYAHPSPKPQIRSSVNHHRRSSSGGWGLFRLGLVKTPEMEVQSLRSRRLSVSSNSSYTYARKSDCDSTRGLLVKGVELEEEKKKKKGGKSLFGSCRCSSDVVVPSRMSKNRRDGGGGGMEMKGRESVSRSRTFEWLRELSIAGAPEA
ncbi:hypothetical protein QJS10_CPA02g00325 [Acorus calamus]|uniref:Uncharacterized protein n=1 Tax=Acorus calamus TaxID=4465 RepID=A0AAV9FGA6_ACOCL|nr:hypothetical protein QJS10_CPA02g00325 [Acorus calamus]